MESTVWLVLILLAPGVLDAVGHTALWLRLRPPEVAGVDVLAYQLVVVEELSLVLVEMRYHLQQVLKQRDLATAPGCDEYLGQQVGFLRFRNAGQG